MQAAALEMTWRGKRQVESHFPSWISLQAEWHGETMDTKQPCHHLSLLLSLTALHPSGKGAEDIFSSVLLLCLLPLLPLLFLLFNYSPIKGSLPTPIPNTLLSPQCPCTSTLFMPNIPSVGTAFPSHPSCLPPTSCI